MNTYNPYQEDPNLRRFNSKVKSLCDPDLDKKTLSFVNKCLSISTNKQVEFTMCDLSNFVYPVDGYSLVDIELSPGLSVLLFDNKLENITLEYPEDSILHYPFGNNTEYFENAGTIENPGYYLLSKTDTYTRGYVLFVEYPVLDIDRNPVLTENKSVKISTYDRELQSFDSIVHTFNTNFSNSMTRNANSLINKIEITNSNLKFSVKIRALLVYSKSETIPFNCGC